MLQGQSSPFFRTVSAVTPEKSIQVRTSDATSLGARLTAREVSVEAVACAYLERVVTRDSTVRAWAHIDPDQVIAEARRLDREGPHGRLFGVPVGIKDVILTKDMPTQHNSTLYAGSRPGIDAACVTILRAAGALIFGKTATVEFAATGRRALTRNPHDPERTPGGSSSGSAAAVADGQVPVALGTQTGASIVRPAAYCGVFGMKPTWNLVSLEGVKKFATSLDTLGWFARSVADLALLHDVFAPGLAPATVSSVPTLRIGSCRSPSWSHAEAPTRDAFDTAAARLRESGATVVELDLPAPFDELVALHSLIMHTEGGGAFLAEYRAYPHLLHESFIRMVTNADGVTYDQLRVAYDSAAACRADFDRIAAGYDAILTPSVTGLAPLGLADTGSYVFGAMWSLLHVPCINIPTAGGVGDLPSGLTLTGPRFSDKRVLEVAQRIAPVLQYRGNFSV
jgi:Asp-tRNA(Asn)/Glu-tRNA(Gln) amidotransferase A subunit family amidase